MVGIPCPTGFFSSPLPQKLEHHLSSRGFSTSGPNGLIYLMSNARFSDIHVNEKNIVLFISVQWA